MLKYAAFSFIAPQTCVRLFSVKLPCFQRYCNGKKMFWKAAASDADFDLILLKTTFLLVFG